MAVKFADLKEDNQLFTILADPSTRPAWWRHLTGDYSDLITGKITKRMCENAYSDLVIEVRKENYIDVYYRGGAIIKRLKFYRGSWSGQIHIAYVPYDKGSLYVDYLLDTDKPEFKLHAYKGMPDCFSPQSLKKIKDRIGQYFPDGSEKALQSQFVLKHPTFLDSEFAYSTGESKKETEDQDNLVDPLSDQYIPGLIRIDLVKVALGRGKIVFVELKRSSDTRLNNSIVKQLSDYHAFIKKNHVNLADYYKKIFSIKKSLEILPRSLRDVEISDYAIEERPVLLIVKEKTGNWGLKQETDLKDQIHAFADLMVVDAPIDPLGPLLE